MTVGELIEHLKQFDYELPVRFSYDYGDRGHTFVAPEVESVEEGCVAFSAYVNEMAEVDDDAGDDREDAVILRG